MCKTNENKHKNKNHRSQYHDQTINFMTSIEIDYTTINQRENTAKSIFVVSIYIHISKAIVLKRFEKGVKDGPNTTNVIYLDANFCIYGMNILDSVCYLIWIVYGQHKQK